MIFGGAAAVLLLNAAASLASPTSHHAQHSAKRSQVSVGPQPAYRPLPASSARNKTCVVPASGDGSDDGPAILKAFQSCNPGGSVVLSANTTYTVGTALDLTFLKHVDWGEFHIPCRTRARVRNRKQAADPIAANWRQTTKVYTNSDQ